MFKGGVGCVHFHFAHNPRPIHEHRVLLLTTFRCPTRSLLVVAAPQGRSGFGGGVSRCNFSVSQKKRTSFKRSHRGSVNVCLSSVCFSLSGLFSSAAGQPVAAHSRAQRHLSDGGVQVNSQLQTPDSSQVFSSSHLCPPHPTQGPAGGGGAAEEAETGRGADAEGGGRGPE